MVVRMRHTRSHTRNRRSHHALKGTRVSASKEGVVHPRHRALLDGSLYRGRSVLDTATKRKTRLQVKNKRDQQESGTGEKEDSKNEEVKA